MDKDSAELKELKQILFKNDLKLNNLLIEK